MPHLAGISAVTTEIRFTREDQCKEQDQTNMPLWISEVLKELAVTQKKEQSKQSKYGINLRNSEM